MRRHKFQSIAPLLGIVSLLILAGCNSLSSEPAEAPVLGATSTADSAPTLVVPTPVPETMALYWGFVGRPLPDDLESMVASGAEEMGLTYLRISPGDLIPEGAKFLIVFGGVGLNLADVPVSPELRVLVVGPASVREENLVRIVPTTDDLRRLGFASGYLSAAVAREWRVGLLANPNVDGAFQEGFISGMDYLCGLCQQAFPPYYVYPLVESWNPESPAFPDPMAQRIRIGEISAYMLAPGVSPDIALPAEGASLRALDYGEVIPSDYSGFIRFEDVPVNFDQILSSWISQESVDGVQAEWAYAAGSNSDTAISEGKLMFVRDLFPLLNSGAIVP